MPETNAESKQEPGNGKPSNSSGTEKLDPSSQTKQIMLPSETDRIRMSRTVMAVAHAYYAASDTTSITTETKIEVIPKDKDDKVPDGEATIDSSIHSTSSSVSRTETEQENKTSEDKLTSSLLDSLWGNKKQMIAQERHRRRIRVLNEELFESVSYSLMLQNKDKNVLRVADASPEQPEDAFACVALLLSNMTLLSGESGYDARVRHILKTASVHVLYKSLKKFYPTPIESSTEEVKKSTGKAEKESIKDVETSHETGKDSGTVNKQEPNADSASKEETKTMTLEYPPHPEFIEIPSQLSDCLDESYQENFDTDVDDIDCITQHQSHLRFLATRRFEAIEKLIATKMLNVVIASSSKEKQKDTTSDKKPDASSSWPYSQKDIIRGLKIGSVGVVAGTLFALTGGLAAPGIAAGLAALGIAGGSAAAAAAITVLTGTTTLMTLFGVGGGGLAAYKMKTRTEGLSEFQIRRENIVQDSENAASVAELHTTVCVSGWLQDKCDFQRPWGITPTDPPITNKIELLKRFYTVHHPERLSHIEEILERFKGREKRLYEIMREKYGSDPDHLLPLELDQMKEASLDEEEEKVINHLLGKVILTKRNTCNLEKAQSSRQLVREQSMRSLRKVTGSVPKIPEDRPAKQEAPISSSNEKSVGKESAKSKKDRVDITQEAYRASSVTQADKVQMSSNAQIPPTTNFETSLVVWDYQSLYGGDLYTITWESDRLLKLCDLVGAIMSEFTSKASKEALKHTALASLMAAVSWPSTIMKVADVIDNPYQIINVRADEAGVELANCLLRSEERRPVTLVGYSFGARIIFSCILELARHQELWEEEQMNAVTRSNTPPQCDEAKDDSSQASNDDKVMYKREPASIVEDVVLMGLPHYIYRDAWLTCRRIVAGRLINCYSRKDWFLSLMFQYKSCTGVLRPTCGTHPVTCVEGVQNYDVSGLVTSHGNYCFAVFDILRLLSFGKPNPIEVKTK